MNTCRVHGCRFKNSHLTVAHRCGVCNKFGHGEMECGNIRKINILKEISTSDTLSPDIHCNLPYCNHRSSHTNNAHHCRKCGERAHCMTTCPHSRRHSRSIFSRQEEESKINIEEKDSESDEETESKPLRKKKKVEEKKHYEIKCPLCKVINVFTNPSKLFVDSNCIVCMNNKAQVLFPTCKHVYVCLPCCNKLNEHCENKSSISVYDSSSPSSSSSMSSSSSTSSSSFFPDDDEGSEFNATRALEGEEGKVYICIPAGLGCSFWYRRNNSFSPLERLFMHSDDWGQYGGNGRVPEHTSFISGYRQVQYLIYTRGH